MHDIRLMAQQSNGWATHDEQFRFRIAHNPAQDWGIVHNELWLLYMTPTLYKPANNPQPKCFDFNLEGNCFKSHCVYAHSRGLKCNNAYPSMSCTNANPASSPSNHFFRAPNPLRNSFNSTYRPPIPAHQPRTIQPWPRNARQPQDIRVLGHSPIINSAIIKY